MPAKKVEEVVEPPSYEELQKRIEALEAEKQAVDQARVDAEQRALERDAEVRALKAQEEGWLITTANPGYDGNLYGVEFKSGIAFVGKNRRFPDFEPTKLDIVAEHKIRTEQFRGYPAEYVDAHIAKIKEREKLSSAERVIEQLERDFGYTVEFFGVDKLDQIKQRVAERQQERAKLDELLSHEENMKGLMMPAYK